MDSVKAHEAYIYAMGISNPQLIDRYNALMKKYPEKAIIPLALGSVYYNAEMPQATDFLKKAAAMQPKNAKIWFMLSIDAMRWGEQGAANEYLRKATLAEPENADYAANYLMSFRDSDPNYKQKVFDFTKRFPASERGAQVLYWLGEDDTNLNDKISDFEALRKLYPPQKFDWSGSGMIGLADAYLQTDPVKALALIDDMKTDGDWKIRKQVAESLIEINKLAENQNYTAAINQLNQVKLPSFNYINDFMALKKAGLQEKSGNVKAAYDSLAVKFAKLPTDQLYTALELYGKKTGRDEVQVVKDIAAIRNSKAVAAYAFDLGLYTANSKLSLKDLKGKVVLLTFWFPGCGPCRGEFPHFQAVMDKFKGDDVEYVGINVSPEQDPYVLPFMKNTKFSFIPLRGNSEFAKQNYGVRGEPTNFLIDKDGKIVFKKFRIDGANHRTLELMIASLLQKDKQSN
ncbi:MAG: redoxin domain-containing protein, partial [Mucilaginibacter sp.]